MVAYHRSSALHAYVLAVSAVGLCLVVLFAVVNGPVIVRHQPPLFWVLLASLLVIESLPIRLRHSAGNAVPQIRLTCPSGTRRRRVAVRPPATPASPRGCSRQDR